MPLTFSATKLREACDAAGLSEDKCKVFAKELRNICLVEKGRGKGGRTSWQECISERRKGKPFDPQAMKELAKEYKAGRCPSGA